MTLRVEMARARAARALAELVLASADGLERDVVIAMGDPQASLDTFLRVLDANALLGDAGYLKPNVRLITIGDYFDYGGAAQASQAAVDGAQILAWLATHPSDQTLLLLGNHDVSRIGELASFNDALFAVAQAEALTLYPSTGTERRREFDFLVRYPGVPSAEVLARDFAAYTDAQKRLMLRLLAARRVALAYAPAPDLLLCHAGVTQDDLSAVGAGAPCDASRAAQALNAALFAAFERWEHEPSATRGPFVIPALHQPGSAALGEGGGILYHRPAHPAHARPERFLGDLRRRFDPRRLPLGMTQVIGHVQDGKCRELLGEWALGEPALPGQLRWLVTDGTQVRYGSERPSQLAAELGGMIFVDGSMHKTPPEQYELLDVVQRRAWHPAH